MAEGQSLRIHQRLDRLHAHPHFQIAKKIVTTLESQGFETLLAGGAVRDSWLGLKPKDLDFATAAPPDLVESTFERTLAVGKAFGTIVVVEENQSFEVTTFRKDGAYGDGRHPASVEFSEAREDALRRDFTVNALFYDCLKEETVDFVGGLEDLKLRRLKTVGDPKTRFSEDYLRMLRAVRFVGQLGFRLEDDAMKAIQLQAESISKVSYERIFNELRRLLEGEFWQEGLRLLQQSQLAPVVWPELNADSPLVFGLPPLNWANAFAMIMFTADAASIESRLRVWKAPREAGRAILSQIAGAKVLIDARATRAAKARVLGAAEFAESLLLAQIFGVETTESVDQFLEVADAAGELPAPLLNGQDLMSLGIEPGPRMGDLLKRLYDAQLEGQVADRTEALALLKQLTS